MLAGAATEKILATYDHERRQAALENAAFACQSQSFIWPATSGEKLFRDAVLALVHDHAWASAFVNTGRASTATAYADSPLSLADDGVFTALCRPGSAAVNLPVRRPDEREGFLLDGWGGRFTALHFLEPGAVPSVDSTTAPAEAAGFALDHLAIVRQTRPRLARCGRSSTRPAACSRPTTPMAARPMFCGPTPTSPPAAAPSPRKERPISSSGR